MAKILITGGTGLVGKHLCIKLQEKGYEVAVLSRSKKNISGFKTYYWDVDKSKNHTFLEGGFEKPLKGAE